MIREALLQAIVDDPADDLPRLAMADWLEENGEDDHARFIRAQLALSASEAPAELKAEESRLWAILAQDEEEQFSRCAALSAFSRQIPRPANLGRCFYCWYPGKSQEVRVTWQRGFPAVAKCPLAAWMEHGQMLVCRHPIERVEVTDCPPLPFPIGREGEAFVWCREGHGPNGHILPEFLGVPLVGQGLHQMPKNAPRTLDAAKEQLSCACLAWAKQQATVEVS